jgi:hypothetical protein
MAAGGDPLAADFFMASLVLCPELRWLIDV